MRAFPLLSLYLLALLAGCNSTPSRDEGVWSVELAVSRQEAATPERQRAKVHTELGRLYLQDGRYEVALNEAAIALEAEGGYAPAHNLKALVYMALRQNSSADDSFRQALRLAPSDPEINNDYGLFLCQTGKPGESIGYFRVAMNNRLYASQGLAMTNAGVCSLRIKADRQAEEFLLRALSLDRANPTALYWLADVAYRDQRPADARQRLKELHALIEPTAESAWLALRVDRKLGDREGEARNMGIMRRKYRESPEYQKLMRGEFD